MKENAHYALRAGDVLSAIDRYVAYCLIISVTIRQLNSRLGLIVEVSY